MLGFISKSTICGLSLTSTSLVLDDTEIPGVDKWLSLASLSLSTTLLVSCNDKRTESKVYDTSLVIESMSLDELYELRDLIEEKENVLKLDRKVMF